MKQPLALFLLAIAAATVAPAHAQLLPQAAAGTSTGADQSLDRIVAVVDDGVILQSELDDAVRATYYLTDAALFEKVAPIFGQYFAKARPAATALVCQLVDPRMKIEIEVTARKRQG